MIKAVLFDMDGVLIDSFDTVAKIIDSAMVEAGHRGLTRAQLRHIYHMTLVDTIKYLVKGASQAEIGKIRELVYKYDRLVTEVKTAKGCAETLDVLGKRYRMAVVSSTERWRVEHLLGLADILDRFELIVSTEDFSRPKPHPEPLCVALKKMGIKPADAVYIGDRKTDVEAAEAAGMKSIGFLGLVDGKLPAADLTTKNFGSIPSLVKKLSLED